MIRWIQRELRSLQHRSWVIMGAIALGVAAVTMVHALADSVNDAVKSQARPMMAADVVVRSMHPPPSELYAIDAESPKRNARNAVDGSKSTGPVPDV